MGDKIDMISFNLYQNNKFIKYFIFLIHSFKKEYYYYIFIMKPTFII